MLLTTPLSRRRWALASALGVGAVILAMMVVLAMGVGNGAASADSGIANPVLGALALGL